MVAIFVLITFAIVIIIQLIRQSQPMKKPLPVPRAIVQVQRLVVSERYFHPTHSWVKVNGKTVVTVGVDDILQRLLGLADEVQLPLVGTAVKQGEPLAVLQHGNRRLTQMAPVSGIVCDVNSAILSQPELINDSPYDRGWIARVRPTGLKRELRNLLHGALAERWKEATRMHLIRLFTPYHAVVLQDGGELLSDVGSLLTDDEWQMVAHEFVPHATLMNANERQRKDETP